MRSLPLACVVVASSIAGPFAARGRAQQQDTVPPRVTIERVSYRVFRLHLSDNGPGDSGLDHYQLLGVRNFGVTIAAPPKCDTAEVIVPLTVQDSTVSGSFSIRVYDCAGRSTPVTVNFFPVPNAVAEDCMEERMLRVWPDPACGSTVSILAPPAYRGAEVRIVSSLGADVVAPVRLGSTSGATITLPALPSGWLGVMVRSGTQIASTRVYHFH